MRKQKGLEMESDRQKRLLADARLEKSVLKDLLEKNRRRPAEAHDGDDANVQTRHLVAPYLPAGRRRSEDGTPRSHTRLPKDLTAHKQDCRRAPTCRLSPDWAHARTWGDHNETHETTTAVRGEWACGEAPMRPK